MKPPCNLAWLVSRPTASSFGSAFLLTVSLAGCRPHADAAPVVAARPPAVHDELPPTIVTPEQAFTLPELFERARQALERGDAVSAARDFDRVVELDPDGALAPRALLDGSEAQERAGSREGALRRLDQLLRRFPDDPLARNALVRQIRLAAFVGRFERAGALGRQLLARYADLRPMEGVVAHGGVALEGVTSGDLEAASFHIARARDLIEQHQLDAAGRIPRDLAAVYYALGEVRRRRAEQIALNPPPADFAARLEQRCQLLLDAQGAYSDAMRAYDARWSAMAGFRVGELYQKLHAELVGIEPDPGLATTSERQLLEAAMRLRYSVLLDKALAMMEHTLALAQRTGERSSFVLRTEQAVRELRQAAEREQEAVARLPYSRQELEAALRELERRVRERRGPRPGSTGPSDDRSRQPGGPRAAPGGEGQ